jgi:hypothetical protein
MKLKPYLFILAALPQIPPAGSVITIDEMTESHDNTNCAATSTCDLLNISQRLIHYKVVIDNIPTFGTKVIASYDTQSVRNLENYAFVLKVKGCTFGSQKNADGTITKWANRAVDSFGESVLYHFKDQVLFSPDKDPLFNSSPNYPNPRHFLYRWNTVTGSFSSLTEKLFGVETPTTPRLYVTQLPEGAYRSEWGDASNLSMKWQTCLYRTKDIPLSTTRDDVNFATPIHCIAWDNSWIYNHQTNQYSSPTEIDPFCE